MKDRGLRGVKRLMLPHLPTEKAVVMWSNKRKRWVCLFDRSHRQMCLRGDPDRMTRWPPVMMGSPHRQRAHRGNVRWLFESWVRSRSSRRSMTRAGRLCVRSRLRFSPMRKDRAGTDMLGSAVATGRIPLWQRLRTGRSERTSVKGATEDRFLGEADERLAAPLCPSGMSHRARSECAARMLTSV